MITIIGGDFTRSWLSLPLSHGIKVKGGKKCPFVIWRVCWPQDVANMLKKLKSLSFSRVSEVALGPLFRVPLLRFGHEIRWCFAVAHVPQSHVFCDWRAGWPQDVANLRNKLKSLSFSRVSEVALGCF